MLRVLLLRNLLYNAFDLSYSDKYTIYGSIFGENGKKNNRTNSKTYVIWMYIYYDYYFYLIDSLGDECLIALLLKPVKRSKIKVII